MFSCAPVVFALLAVVFFIIEEAGAGGNIPLYELYVVQTAPFLGLIAFALLSGSLVRVWLRWCFCL